jgi:hypothetical protein
MGTKSRDKLYGTSVRMAAERAAEARREADKLACEAWTKRMLAFKGPAQPSPTLGDALNAGYRGINIARLRDSPAEWSRQFEGIRNNSACPNAVAAEGLAPVRQKSDVSRWALSARNGILGCRDRATEIGGRDNIRPQRPKGPETGRANPGTKRPI